MKSLIGFLCVLAVAHAQTQYPVYSCTNSIRAGLVGGRYWRWNDFPRNATTQDFADINNPPSNYLYIPNGEGTNGKQLFDANWVPQNMSAKLSEYARVRPVGYKYGMVEPYNILVPCLTVQGVRGFGVEIMLYAMDDVRICIRDVHGSNTLNSQAGQLFNNVCGQQRLRHCFIGPTTRDIQFEIYIDSTNPPDYSVGVFYRMRRSAYSYANQGNQFTSDNTEMWCMMISGSVDSTYPEFLGSTPNGLVIPPTNSAPSARILSSLVMGIVGLFVVM